MYTGTPVGAVKFAFLLTDSIYVRSAPLSYDENESFGEIVVYSTHKIHDMIDDQQHDLYY